MTDPSPQLPPGAGGLAEGSELDGVGLRRLIAADEFCSLWLIDPLAEGLEDSCMRVIPAAHLQVPDGPQRLCAELNFWQQLRDAQVVDLYECGNEGGYCYMLMRYMPQGSAEQQSESWIHDHLMEFATDLAVALRALHGTLGAHGNLKPSNVFPVRGKGVLLSDFLLPLWLDEFEAASETIKRRMQHPYRAPEQQADLRDYDTRSDVYSFALILLRCLTGAAPDSATAAASAPWPEDLAPIAQRCLAPNRDRRFADGEELLEAMHEAGHLTSSFAALIIEDADKAPSERPPRKPAAERLDEARAKVAEGHLEEALAILESLPLEAAGMDELLDEIEHREQASAKLAEEAVRLAGMGQIDAAMDTIAQAQKLAADSSTVRAVREELGAGEAEMALSGRIPAPLREALEKGRYAAARPLLEKLIRNGPVTDETREAVRQFKRGRVRKAFLDNIEAARRLYLSGDLEKATEHWLEAALWMPSGPERERLRRIARAAARGKLSLQGKTPPNDRQKEEPVPQSQPDQPRPSAPTGPARPWKGLPPVVRLGLLALAIVAVFVLLLVLLRR